jgi:hypothetical protein
VQSIFKAHTVTVETYTGPGDDGDTYAAAVEVVGLLEDGLQLLQSGPTGDVVASVTVFYCDVSEAARFKPESRVTTPAGDVMQVDVVKRRDAGALFAPVSHLEVRLK